MSTHSIPKLQLQAVCSTLPGMARQSNLPDWDKIEVGKRIVTLRLAKNKMQAKALAEAIGISPQNLNNYESGRDQLRIEHAAQICIHTGANFDYLYRGLIGHLPPDLADAIRAAMKNMPAKFAKRA